MNDSSQNELLSAYLDGELTAEEQAQVEELLAKSPKARQLMDDLRRLSNTLQSLPQCKLGEDLSAQVLRAAERKMLTGQLSAAPEAAAAEMPSPPARARNVFRAAMRRMLSRRAILWTSVVLAVAVLFALEDRQNWRSRLIGPVAQQATSAKSERLEKPAAENASDDHSTAEPFVTPQISAAPAPVVDAAPAGNAAPPDRVAASADRKNGYAAAPPTPKADEMRMYRDGAAGPGFGHNLPAPPHGASAKAPIEASAEPAAMEKSGIAADAPSNTTGEMKPVYAPAGQPQNNALAQDGGAAKMAMNGGRAGGLGASRGLGPAQDREPRAARPAMAMKAPQVGKGSGSAPMGEMTQQSVLGGQNLHARLQAAPQGVLVVQCEITRKAAADHVLDRLLAKQKLAIEPSVASQAAANTDQTKRDGGAKDQEHSARQESRRAQLGDLDLVSIEATAEQLDAALEQMAAAPEEFLAVSVEPRSGQSADAVDGQSRLPRPNVLREKPGQGGLPRVTIAAAPGAAPPERDDAAKADEDAKIEAAEEQTDRGAPGIAADKLAERKGIESEPSAGLAVAEPPAAAPAPAPTVEMPASPNMIAGPLAAPAESLTTKKAEGSGEEKQKEQTEKLKDEQAVRYRVLFVVRVVDAPAQAAAATEAGKAPAKANLDEGTRPAEAGDSSPIPADAKQ